MGFDPFIDAFTTLQNYGTMEQRPKYVEWSVTNKDYGHTVDLYFNKQGLPVLSVDACSLHRGRRIVIRCQDDLRRFRAHMSKLRMGHSPDVLG